MTNQRTNKHEERMNACMRLRELSPATQDLYRRSVRHLVEYHKKAPGGMKENEITDFMIHLRDERGLSSSSINVYHAGLKFLFRNVLGKPDMVKPWQRPRKKYVLPEVCTQMEILSLLKAVESPVYRTIFLVMYGAGLRVGEAVKIQVEDIDATNMIIRIRQGKGGVDRSAKMCNLLLFTLRDYWRRTRPPRPYLFPGKTPDTHISRDSVRQVLKKVANQCNIKIRVTPHTIRHSFATHLLQSGVDVRVIQDLLGHRSIRSTQIYTHVTPTHVQNVQSPLELLLSAIQEK